MSGTVTLLQLAGYVGLLLWGTHMASTGVERGFGAELRLWLGRTLSRPGGRARLYALLSGLAVTAVLQSSTATGLITASFTASGAIGFGTGTRGDARRQCRQHLDHPDLGLQHRRGRSSPRVESSSSARPTTAVAEISAVSASASG